MLVVEIALHLAAVLATILLAYFILGVVAYLWYTPATAAQKADNVRIVVITIGSENIRSALFECLAHHREMFDEYELYCVTDEGADLETELRDLDGYQTLVVPDSYECNAIAKGRAIHYFIEAVVTSDPDYWYAFIDDDNLVLDDQFLYEIPYYEEHGYGAMNPVLQPRQGNSTITYIMDHVRLLDDLTIFRAFTGLLGRPYISFHGELLTARGDVLVDVGFDRPSIVEDFAFAAELIKHDIRTWQSDTRVSILSPHTLTELFKQRSRWFLGVWDLLWQSSPLTRVITSVRVGSWLLPMLAIPIGMFLWQTSTQLVVPDVVKVAPPVAGLVYGGAYLYGILTGGDRRAIILIVFIPLFLIFEVLSPLYAFVKEEREFTVIEK